MGEETEFGRIYASERVRKINTEETGTVCGYTKDGDYKVNWDNQKKETNVFRSNLKLLKEKS